MNSNGSFRKLSRVLLVTACGIVVACDNNSKTPSTTPVPESPNDKPKFVDVASSSGIDFVHLTGASGQFYFPEIVGAGGALLDYDSDGDLDVYLIQSGTLDGSSSNASLTGNRLYRNDGYSIDSGQFVDVTEEAGVGHTGYGMGVATGDYDNDGDLDLYVTNFGDNVLYRNDGTGHFTDVTVESGTNDSGWSTSASFIDTDNDGDLDLFVTRYVNYSIDANKPCKDSAGRLDYCSPSQYPATADTLFENRGDGRFIDISKQAGITAQQGPGLGIIGADLDNDGLTDIVVANDQQANFFWRNLGNNTFEESGLMSGIAYNSAGKAEASMGITSGDFDGDGDEDLFMTHLTTETNTLYLNDGGGRFADATTMSALGPPSLRYTGFGSRWFDFDNDGDLDIFVANGAVVIKNELVDMSSYPYEESNQLFENIGGQKFVEKTNQAGFGSMPPLVSRGAAFGDIDNDGDVDILVTNSNGPIHLLLNKTDSPSSSIHVSLTGTSSNQGALGTRVALLYSNGETVWRRVHTDGSYASASDVRVHFAKKADDVIKGIAVVWPSGSREWWPGEPSTHTVQLREGSGEPWLTE
ncbi:MAG: CRTAC1 family protein [Gammaproteobacteria bacterium]